ncbi:hypothetical protein [Roseovarius sp.]|uniref:hypothetical protein n=1 Tax=Roseovarius sp. TaxID=1486281 RepID=UPI000C56A64C|nr:hypothetical protein [Roseovarius sp.]MAZ20607.1 hypothetical protein [Roseovarius sp.]
MAKPQLRILVTSSLLMAFGSASFAEGLPPELSQNMSIFPGFRAIYENDPSLASKSEIATDAFHILQAIAKHPASCIFANAEEVPFSVTVKKSEVNSYGVEMNSETQTLTGSIAVRPEFVPWVKANIKFLNSNPLSGVRNGVDTLLTTQGCDSEHMTRIEQGLATAFGVSLSAKPTQKLGDGNWETFVDSCYPASVQSYMEATGGEEPSLSMIVYACVCTEAALQEIGDPEIYADFATGDYSAYEQIKDVYDPAFDQCFRQGTTPEIEKRIEDYTRKHGLL